MKKQLMKLQDLKMNLIIVLSLFGVYCGHEKSVSSEIEFLEGCYGVLIDKDSWPLIHCQCKEKGVGKEINSPTYFPRASLFMRSDSIFFMNGQKTISSGQIRDKVMMDIGIRRIETNGVLEVNRLKLENCACLFEEGKQHQSSSVDSCYFELRQQILGVDTKN